MSAVLVSFKAGKLLLEETRGWLKPDTRRGTLRLVQGDEGLVQLQWLERPASGEELAPVEDIVVFPGECGLHQISSSRNFVLKFPAETDRNLFFWMQEPDPASDAALVARFNRVLQGDLDTEMSPAQAQAPAAAEGTAPAAHAAGAALQPQGQGQAGPPLAGASAGISAVPSTARPGQPDLASALSSALAAALGPPAAAAAASPPDAMEQLTASLLARLAAQGPGSGAGGPSMAQRQAMQAMASDQGPSLGQVLKPEVLIPLLSQPEGRALEKLAEYLPEEHRNQGDMLGTLSSPAFRQQLSSFSSALQTGQLSLAQFGLQAKGFSVAAFLEAIQQSVDHEKQQQQGAAAAPGGGDPAPK